jgi:hypothetical protein
LKPGDACELMDRHRAARASNRAKHDRRQRGSICRRQDLGNGFDRRPLDDRDAARRQVVGCASSAAVVTGRASR